MAADDAARRSGPAPAGLNPSSRARGRRCDCSVSAWVTFDGFSGDCRLADVRFYPVSVQPGPARKRCVWPDPCDSSFQTGARIMRYELADDEWIAIKPMLPNKPRGVPRVNDRRVLNGIFWVLRSGAPWRDLPEMFGPYTTCYNRFVRWRRAGVWGRIIDTLAAPHDAAVQMIDTSIVRVHQHGACTPGIGANRWEGHGAA